MSTPITTDNCLSKSWNKSTEPVITEDDLRNALILLAGKTRIRNLQVILGCLNSGKFDLVGDAINRLAQACASFREEDAK